MPLRGWIVPVGDAIPDRRVGGARGVTGGFGGIEVAKRRLAGRIPKRRLGTTRFFGRAWERPLHDTTTRFFGGAWERQGFGGRRLRGGRGLGALGAAGVWGGLGR